MLDDVNVLKQRDPSGTLGLIARVADDTTWQPEIIAPDHDGREIRNIVVCGMGGSALAADIVRTLTSSWLNVPLTIVRGYDLPGYAWHNTLVIAISHSGNTEETMQCFDQALERDCQIAAIGAGGALIDHATQHSIVHVKVPKGIQPRMSTFTHMRAILRLLNHFGCIDSTLYDELGSSRDWLVEAMTQWHHEVPIHQNLAKQLAVAAVGKTPVVYGGQLTGPLAYKWKISWNENAKNTAFCNVYPEFNHNEFIGWSSHPVEKPFVVYDLISNLERTRILQRMRLSDRLLSGKRPKTTEIHLEGDTLLKQSLWACVLADYITIYVAILNGVDPQPVELVERFKLELSAHDPNDI